MKYLFTPDEVIFCIFPRTYEPTWGIRAIDVLANTAGTPIDKTPPEFFYAFEQTILPNGHLDFKRIELIYWEERFYKVQRSEGKIYPLLSSHHQQEEDAWGNESINDPNLLNQLNAVLERSRDLIEENPLPLPDITKAHFRAYAHKTFVESAANEFKTRERYGKKITAFPQAIYEITTLEGRKWRIPEDQLKDILVYLSPFLESIANFSHSSFQYRHLLSRVVQRQVTQEIENQASSGTPLSVDMVQQVYALQDLLYPSNMASLMEYKSFRERDTTYAEALEIFRVILCQEAQFKGSVEVIPTILEIPVEEDSSLVTKFDVDLTLEESALFLVVIKQLKGVFGGQPLSPSFSLSNTTLFTPDALLQLQTFLTHLLESLNKPKTPSKWRDINKELKVRLSQETNDSVARNTPLLLTPAGNKKDLFNAKERRLTDGLNTVKRAVDQALKRPCLGNYPDLKTHDTTLSAQVSRMLPRVCPDVFGLSCLLKQASAPQKIALLRDPQGRFIIKKIKSFSDFFTLISCDSSAERQSSDWIEELIQALGERLPPFMQNAKDMHSLLPLLTLQERSNLIHSITGEQWRDLLLASECSLLLDLLEQHEMEWVSSSLTTVQSGRDFLILFSRLTPHQREYGFNLIPLKHWSNLTFTAEELAQGLPLLNEDQIKSTQIRDLSIRVIQGAQDFILLFPALKKIITEEEQASFISEIKYRTIKTLDDVATIAKSEVVNSSQLKQLFDYFVATVFPRLERKDAGLSRLMKALPLYNQDLHRELVLFWTDSIRSYSNFINLWCAIKEIPEATGWFLAAVKTRWPNILTYKTAVSLKKPSDMQSALFQDELSRFIVLLLDTPELSSLWPSFFTAVPDLFSFLILDGPTYQKFFAQLPSAYFHFLTSLHSQFLNDLEREKVTISEIIFRENLYLFCEPFFTRCMKEPNFKTIVMPYLSDIFIALIPEMSQLQVIHAQSVSPALRTAYPEGIPPEVMAEQQGKMSEELFQFFLEAGSLFLLIKTAADLKAVLANLNPMQQEQLIWDMRDTLPTLFSSAESYIAFYLETPSKQAKQQLISHLIPALHQYDAQALTAVFQQDFTASELEAIGIQVHPETARHSPAALAEKKSEVSAPGAPPGTEAYRPEVGFPAESPPATSDHSAKRMAVELPFFDAAATDCKPPCRLPEETMEP